ncbi:hypothetical protein [Afifella pfennigii]|uniref:hypothetical protein n=1 Tax=Afifella pfennigii TaxID=209897 RepID=UPI00047BD401|nr:hypothetical protein [Afifella pfennigii]
MHRLLASALLASFFAVPATPLPAAEPFSFDKGKGTCAVLTSRYPPQQLWFGWVSAKRKPIYADGTRPFYAEGCFRTERECRRFINEGVSFANGPVVTMGCRPGVPARALR